MTTDFYVGDHLVHPSLNRIVRNGHEIRVEPKAMHVLCVLAEHSGRVVGRDELMQAVWPGTFVTDDALKRCVSDLRKALGDSTRHPAFIETIAKGGYRLIAQVSAVADATPTATSRWHVRISIAAAVLLLCGVTAAVQIIRLRSSGSASKTALYRITFGPGLQHGPSWSPDGRYVAYGGGDIWVTPLAGGEPARVTKHPAFDWQPSYSPDGNEIVFRSERDGGGLFIVPALGGHERRLTTFGFYPRWSPDGSRVLFTGAFIPTSIYVVALDGTPPREIGQTVTNRFERLWATWHPDGKRISIWGLPKVPKEKDYSTYREGAGVVEFWTFSLDQGTAIRSELAPNVEQRYRDEGLDTWVFDFTWRPSADAVFFSAGSRGVRNIWKVTVDPTSLRWIGGPERLTTGAGDDRWVAISADGRKLAFNAESDVPRLWSFGFDAARGKLLDQGEPLTPADAKPTGVALNADGSRVAFVIAKRGERSSRTELRERVFASSTDRVLIADGHSRDEPRWSPDSRLLAYNRDSVPTILDTTSGLEQPLRDSKEMWLGDWSPDGHSIIGVTDGTSTTTNEMWTVPVKVDDATARPRMVAGNAQYRVYQPMFSPDGRWICFNGVKGSDYRTSTLFVMSSSGGPWIQLTDGHYWDDVPRWAPDGTAIYFLSTRSRGGPAFDIWGLRFDPVRGLPKGEPFQVSSFQVSPDRDDRVILIQDQLMAIGRDRLIVTMWNVSGNIWVLEEP